jgi:hypothetical protein
MLRLFAAMLALLSSRGSEYAGSTGFYMILGSFCADG